MEKLKIKGASSLSNNIFDLFINPLIIGSYGFAIIFIVLVGIKAIGLYFGRYEEIAIEMDDIWLSLWGFGFYFVIKLIVNLNRRFKLIIPQAFKLSDKVKNLI